MVKLKHYILERYSPYLKIKRRGDRFKKDFGVLKIVIDYKLSEMKLNKICKSDIEEFLFQIEKDRDISGATLNRYRARLHHIFSHAIDNNLISVNPVSRVKKRKEYPRTVSLTKEQIGELLKYSKRSSNHELYYVVSIALYTGMRLNEILQMKKRNLIGNIYRLDAISNKSKIDRNIILHSNAIELINTFLNQYPNDGEQIFITKYIKRSFYTAIKSAGLSGVRFHDLRHTFATHLSDNGASIKSIQCLLGHSSLLLTQNYITSNDKKLIDDIEKLCFG